MKLVKVYSDPLARQRLEGIAQVLRPVRADYSGNLPPLEMWEVRFFGRPAELRCIHSSDIFEFEAAKNPGPGCRNWRKERRSAHNRKGVGV
ncbi:MAG TPA: hypothetical protein VGP72_12665 [Planctomycetota bacterium]|jgi:hypothetical protein